jgi:cysteine-rich repeat protein
MKIRYLLGLFVLGTMANAACGDDGPEGAGGAGGSGAGTGLGGDGGQGATSDGGQGGSVNQGGESGTGGNDQGGSGGGSAINDGIACTSDAQCDSGRCLGEADFGWPNGGYCTGLCPLTTPDCPGGGLCVDVGFDNGNGLCFSTCEAPADCRAGYDCISAGSRSVCYPHCTAASQCPEVGTCDTDAGLCQAVETECTNGLDDDNDGDADCSDPNCDETCGPLIEAACSGALTETTGNTTTGTTVFAGSCIEAAGKTAVHTFTPGTAGQLGVLTITLSSATEHALYARSTCADTTTELGCSDAPSTGAQEVLEVPVTGGEPVAVFVAASAAGEEGPYTLAYSFAPSVCGNGTVEFGEACDDGNTLPGDGCAADCTVELAPFCTAASLAVLGANSGDTTTGSTSFTGDEANGCLVDTAGREQLWRFIPLASGTLTLTLASDADLGVYVRTDCESAASTVDCRDLEIAGTVETLEVPVTAATPVFIFVDGFTATDAGPYTLTLAM